MTNWSVPNFPCNRAEAAMIDPDPPALEEDQRLEADPEPDLGERRAGSVRIAITAIASAAIVMVTLYGLTHQRDEAQQASAAPAAQSSGSSETTGSAPAN